MPRARGSVPAARAELFDAYVAYLATTGRTNVLYTEAARQFLVRWADLADWAGQPLTARLGGNAHNQPFTMFLMLNGELHPGYDYLVARKLTSLWREISHTPLAADLERFDVVATNWVSPNGCARQSSLRSWLDCSYRAGGPWLS